MNRVPPACVSLFLLLSACSGSDGAGEVSAPTAGAAGNNETLNSGGNSAVGGASGENGGTNATGGTSANGGSGEIGCTNASGGNNATGGSGTNGGQGGTNAIGGSSSAGASAQGGSPSSTIDYSIWVLQLPIGSGTSPTTISSKQLTAGFTNEYFYKATDGGQTFMDPATGIATIGSQHCRTEMRESTTGGGQAAWASTGTNTLTVSGKVLKVGGGSSGTVTVGQLFNGTDSIPLIELEYGSSIGGFKLLYEEAKGGGSTTNLNTAVALNTKYTFTLAMTNGVASVSINGKQVYTHTPSADTLAKKFYFKFGNYDQTTAAGAISATPYTIVEAYSADVLHQ